MPVAKKQFRDTGSLNPINWSHLGACVGLDTDIFYPEATQDERRNGMWIAPDWNPARQVCYTCKVRTQCYEYAQLTDEEFGVWGGFTPEERQVMKRDGLEPDLTVTRIGSKKSLDLTTLDSILAQMDYGKPSLGRSKSGKRTSQ